MIMNNTNIIMLAQLRLAALGCERRATGFSGLNGL